MGLLFSPTKNSKIGDKCIDLNMSFVGGIIESTDKCFSFLWGLRPEASYGVGEITLSPRWAKPSISHVLLQRQQLASVGRREGGLKEMFEGL